MTWTEEEKEALQDVADASTTADRALNIATKAVELAAARGGTPVELPDGFDDVLTDMETCGTKREAQAAVTVRGLLASHRSQGATVATLQAMLAERETLLSGFRERETTYEQALATLLAKVAELERRHEETLEQWSGDRKHANTLALDLGAASSETLRQVALRVRDERDTLRAEVERMKPLARDTEESRRATAKAWAEVERLKAESRARMALILAADSCLASVRKNLGNVADVRRVAETGWVGVSTWDETVRADVKAAGALPYLHHAAERVAAWALEVAAPNPSMPSNGSDTMTTAQQHAVMDETCDECGELGGPHRPLPVYRDELPRMCSKASHTAQHADLQRLTGALPQAADRHDIYQCSVENCSACAHTIAAEIEDNGPAAVAVGFASAAGLPVRVVPPDAKRQEDPLLSAVNQNRRILGMAPLRHPGSEPSTHDDAAKAGHPERVNERSEAVKKTLRADPETCEHNVHYRDTCGQCEQDRGAGSMRAAVEAWARGCFGDVPPTLKDAMDGV